MSGDAGQPTNEAAPAPAAQAVETSERNGWWSRTIDQFGYQQLVSDYKIPVNTNGLLYSLGGVLAIALGFEIVTGLLLTYLYVPDANLAYGITAGMLASTGWSVVLNFHFWNAFLIFALVFIHMMRAFVSGGYRGGKTGLWLIGVGLAGFVFLLSVTGEALHWDEVGFGVPWNIGEALEAVGLAGLFNYSPEGLLDIATASEKLSQLYALHISIVAIVLGLFMIWHLMLIRFKGISQPFWVAASSVMGSFSKHLRSWIIYSTILLGIVLLISIFVPRDPGVAPQLISSSPLFGVDDDPGGLGFKPNFPISWTRGMNILFAQLGIDPDIWGTIVGMAILLLVLLIIPFIDRGKLAPATVREAFDVRKRGWAFAAMIVFWVVLAGGLAVNFFTAEG
jgi:ubiquinol-cytochrome c reductase cytochrome b subunit